MNPFAGLNEASSKQSGSYLTDGEYKLKVVKCIYRKSEGSDDGHYAFIAEMVVTESNNPAHPVNSERSWYQKENKSFKSEIKSFYLAAVGYDEGNPEHVKLIQEQVGKRAEAVMGKALSHGVLRGREVAVSVTTKPQKKDSTKKFTEHKFKPAQGPIPVEVLDKAIALT